MEFEPRPHVKELIERVREFIYTKVIPFEDEHRRDFHPDRTGADWTKWEVPAELEALKRDAKSQGLWNFFLPDDRLGAGLSVPEYALIAEETGHSMMAPEAFNCSAPDTGNMEVLWRYGSPEQQERWLKPLLAGEIRSVFGMTEPAVASSDATNMETTAVLEGDQVVINGRKWWSSGIGDPRAEIMIVMAKTPADELGRHQQHSMVLVPTKTEGVTIERMLPVFGDHDAFHGHGEVSYDNVRVPVSNVIAGLGRGFEIAQGRLGPGRIHHCMRCIGAAERTLDLILQRAEGRVAFGKKLIDLGGNRERVAEARIAIDQARLLTLYAAWKLDKMGAKGAKTEIAAIKVVAPNMLQKVVDFAIQIHGGGGVTKDFPLTNFFAQARTLRIADGPDEVHLGTIAKQEIGRFSAGQAGSPFL
ncbi:MAG: acyl-CoA dehydrogenase family protein [Pseudomonadota bacterium]